jgi:VanZ family protein
LHLIDIGLAMVVAGLVYATLHPWMGWRIPAHSIFRFLGLAWPRFWTWFDVVSNLLAYIPLGILVALRFRQNWRGGRIVVAALLVGALLSLTLETLQNFLPTRVPSRLDLLINTLGALLGASVALLFAPRPHDERELIWHRPGFFSHESLPFLLIVALWLVAQFTPQRMLYETGTLVSPVIQTLSTHIDRSIDASRPSVEFAVALAPWLERLQVDIAYSILIEAAAVSIWVACIGLLLIDSLATYRSRAIAIGAILFGAFLLRGVALAVVTGNLEFGLWLSAGAQAGLLLGPILLLLLSGIRRRDRLWWLLGLLGAGLILSNIMPDNIYRQQMLRHAAEPGALRPLLTSIRTLAMFWPIAALIVVARQLYLHYQRWEDIPFMNESVTSRHRRLPESA